jgi:dipeptidyl aminopeptidase/acylaminoacyl peptidase
MKLRSLAAGLAGFAGVFACLPAAQAVLPIETYGKDPEVSDVQISPDGNKLAMLRPDAGGAGLMVLDLKTDKATQYNLGDIKVRNVEWSSNDHLLFYATETTHNIAFRSSMIEFCGVFSLDTRSKKDPKQLMVTGQNLAIHASLCDVRANLLNETGDVLMAADTDVKGVPGGERDLYQVNGNSGRGRIVARGAALTWLWIASPQGHVIARVDYSSRSDRYRILVPRGEDRLSDFDPIFTDETQVPEMSVYGANNAGTALIVGTRSKTGTFGLYEMSLQDGSIGAPLFEPPGVDVSGAIKDPYTGAVVGVNYALHRNEQVFFENELQGVLMGTQRALKDWQDVRIKSWDRARQKYVLFAQGDTSAGDYFLFDRSAGKLRHLQRAYPDVTAEQMASVSAFTYPARDGLKLNAYLTLPPGVKREQAKNLPLVMFPHGGPASRDVQTYDYWAQAMASRGYAVLQVNFRGSEGYGDDFELAGHGEWGGKMQDDVTDGVKHLISQGIADPKRVCIVGASYGGYAALAGAAFTPDIYKCAVSVAGVSHLARKMAWVNNRYGAKSPTYEYWKDSMGDNADVWLARSPAAAAQNVTAATLLIHGKDDTVVPYFQSELMNDALKAAGKPVQFVTLDGEDHWLSKAKTRVQMLKAIDGFLVQHLGTGGAASVQAN